MIGLPLRSAGSESGVASPATLGTGESGQLPAPDLIINAYKLVVKYSRNVIFLWSDMSTGVPHGHAWRQRVSVR
jgi:hypothetical protein